MAACRVMDDHECTSCEAMIATVANVFANLIVIDTQAYGEGIMD